MDTSDYDLILPGDQLGHHLWIEIPTQSHARVRALTANHRVTESTCVIRKICVL
jgi:hypothetical protein